MIFYTYIGKTLIIATELMPPVKAIVQKASKRGYTECAGAINRNVGARGLRGPLQYWDGGLRRE